MISSILKRRGNWNTYNERQVFIVDLRLPWKVGSILPSTLDAVGSVLGRGTYGVKEVCELRGPPPPPPPALQYQGHRWEGGVYLWLYLAGTLWRISGTLPGWGLERPCPPELKIMSVCPHPPCSCRGLDIVIYWQQGLVSPLSRAACEEDECGIDVWVLWRGDCL